MIYLVKEKITDKIDVDLGGIGGGHVGKIPHQGARKILDRQQISYEGIKARQVLKKEWENFNYIIAMDDQNIKDLQKINSQYEEIVVAKLMDFVEEINEQEVPDPYYTGNFDYTFELVTEGCSNFLSYIRDEHNI